MNDKNVRKINVDVISYVVSHPTINASLIQCCDDDVEIILLGFL